MRSFLAIIILACSISTPVLASEDIELLVLRSQHKLVVKKNGVTLRTFKVAFGSGGKKAKLREGDHTTPKGKYQINRVRDSGRFHVFIHLNYPNKDDAKRALKNHSISHQEYRDIVYALDTGRLPPQNTALGGDIGLHGIGLETKDKLEIHQIADWTQGCIAMRNHEIEELSRYIDVGTSITIID